MANRVSGMVEAQRHGGLHVNDSFELGRGLDWQIGRLFAIENAIDVTGR